MSLVIQDANLDSADRLPYSVSETQSIIDAATLKDDEKRRIVIVLALTGARLAEIVGLRTVDVDLEKGFIHIQEHEARGLKTPSSNRCIPLLPIARTALSRQLSESDSDYLFPTYASAKGTKADSASATLNKWAKTIVPNRTMHSFRHSLRDRLRAVLCPEAVAKEIGGWSTSHDVSVQYGQGYPLALKQEWLSKAYEWLRD